VKTHLFVALLFASTLSGKHRGSAPAPFNEIGVTMGHWHIASKTCGSGQEALSAMAASCTCPWNPLIMFRPLHQIWSPARRKEMAPPRVRW